MSLRRSPPAPGRPRALRAWPVAAIVGIVVAHAALNGARLAEQSFWTDELFSVSQANLDLIPMLKLQAADNHPPLYAAVVWAWLRLTHDATEAGVRLVSLLAIAGGIAVLGLATLRRAGVGPAAIVITLAATSTLVASFTWEARMHGLAFGLICVATAAWMELLGRRWLTPGWLVLFAAAGGLASLTQYYAFLVYALEAGAVVAWLVAARARRSQLASVVVLGGLSTLPVVVWLIATRRLLNASGTPPLTMEWADDVGATSLQPYADAIFGPAPEAHRGVLLALVVAGTAAAMLGLAVLRQRRDRAGGAPRVNVTAGSLAPVDPASTVSDPGILLLAGAALAVSVSAVAIATLESVVLMPTLHYRSVMAILPVLYLGLGLSMTAPFGRYASAAGIGIAGILAAVAVITPPPALYAKDDWRSAAAIVREERDAGLAANRIVLVAPWNQREWLVELNNTYGRPAPVSDLPSQLHGLVWVAEAADLAALPDDAPLLLVAFHFWRWEAHSAIVDTTRNRFDPCRDQSVRGITILRCDGGAAPR